MIIVDRIEGDIVVCEIDGVMTEVPLSKMSGRVREGDMLTDNGNGLFTVDAAGTAQRRAAISDRFERLKARQKKAE
ncbi:MAG: DUF3006 domain-containing protein [Dehalococcoidia bacterium]|nr:DUF3006 domain-containing protein [Dehalococcoidia bacterium]